MPLLKLLLLYMLLLAEKGDDPLRFDLVYPEPPSLPSAEPRPSACPTRPRRKRPPRQGFPPACSSPARLDGHECAPLTKGFIPLAATPIF